MKYKNKNMNFLWISAQINFSMMNGAYFETKLFKTQGL